MTYRRLAWAGGVALVVATAPVAAHSEPPTKCLTNTQKGKQVYVPCDLLNAGANYPPGQRCPLPIEQYPKDVADWCGDGPGLPSPTPTTPTTPTIPTSPSRPGTPTAPTTTPATTAIPTTTPTAAVTATSPVSTP
jgi:hypothetical protein